MERITGLVLSIKEFDGIQIDVGDGRTAVVKVLRAVKGRVLIRIEAPEGRRVVRVRTDRATGRVSAISGPAPTEQAAAG